MEYLTVEQVATMYDIPTHKARRALVGKGKAVDVKIGDKNRKLYSKALVLSVFGEPPIEPTESQNPSKTEKNEPPTVPHKPPRSIDKIRVIFLKRLVANLERERDDLRNQYQRDTDHLRSQNQNLTKLLAMEKQAALQAPKNGEINDLKTNETKKIGESIGNLFLFVLVAVSVLFLGVLFISNW